MVSIKEKVHAEMENIAVVLAELEKVKDSFRHFLTHSYGFLLDEEKLKPLMEYIPNVYSEFKGEIDNYLTKIVE
jgi:hypothetical protein